MQKIYARIVKPKTKKKPDKTNKKLYYTITEIAKKYKLSGIKLNKLLCEDKILFFNGRNYVMYTEYHKMHYTKFINNLHGYGQLFWTEKGKLFLYKYLDEKGYTRIKRSENNDNRNKNLQRGKQIKI